MVLELLSPLLVFEFSLSISLLQFSCALSWNQTADTDKRKPRKLKKKKRGLYFKLQWGASVPQSCGSRHWVTEHSSEN